MTGIASQLLLSLFNIVNRMLKLRMLLFITLLMSTLSGCQLITDLNSNGELNDSENKKVSLSQYYLGLKNLNTEELTQEILKQQQIKELDTAAADVHLIVLYSLPNSPIHNPYTAKTLLNDYPLPPYRDTSLNPEDLAFIVMLKEQLNQQLLLLEKLTNYKGVYRQSKKINAEQKLKIDQLNKQIIQLKKIEKTISKRGQ